MFEWQSFLTSRHIEFVTRGPSATRGNIAVKCPFCTDDPSYHMAISLEGKGWRCFRSDKHSGKSNARLIAALCMIPLSQAHLIAGTKHRPSGDIASHVRELLSPQVHHDRHPIDMPPEFKLFKGSPMEKPFANYLKQRGFKDPVRLSHDYDLRYARHGDFRYRIIFPIYHEHALVNWTARTIGSSSLRYKTMPKEEAGGAISDYLLWYDDLMTCDCDTIVLCEGPFDALKVNVLGRQDGVCATCFFTIAPSRAQTDLLHELLPRFKRRLLVQDTGAYAQSLRTTSQLFYFGLDNVTLPRGLKDPAQLSGRHWRDFCACINMR